MAADLILQSVAEKAYANSERWFPSVHGRGFNAVTNHLALGLGGECGEVLDVLKKVDICGLVSSCDLHPDGKHDKAKLGSEMADLFTYLVNLAHHMNIDLIAEFNAKQAECARRWDRPNPWEAALLAAGVDPETAKRAGALAASNTHLSDDEVSELTTPTRSTP